MDKQHPEGLTFEPEGHGFTSKVDEFYTPPLLLLTSRNIKAARKNHREEFEEAFDALPARQRDKRTGRFTSGFTDDERERLATLATFVNHGLFIDDRRGQIVTDSMVPKPKIDKPIVGERITQSDAGDECDCDECTCGRS